MNKQVKLNLKQNQNNLAEIFQSVVVKFSFVTKQNDEEYTQITDDVKCRDFLGDLLFSRVHKKPARIWGFYYDYKETPYDDDKLRLSIKFPDEGTYNNFVNNTHLLDTLEDQCGTETYVIYTTEDPLRIILEADKVWQSEVWKLSLYTFYLKLVCYSSIEELKAPEKDYYKVFSSFNKVTELLHKVTKDNNDVVPDNMALAHNNSGIMALIKNQHYLTKNNPNFWTI